MNKSSKFRRIIASFFLTIFLPTLMPNNLYASNNGPNAPEAASFEPVDATDMVSLATGDMAYVLPILNVPSPEGGYPISLAYHGGIGQDQESSWVGLGWNLNPGAINRSVNGAPDDWKGAEIREKEHFTSWGKSTSLSVGYQNVVDVSLAYSWDSNGATKGGVALGIGKEMGGGSYIGAQVGVSVSNQSGINGSFAVGVGLKSGFSAGVYADTEGVIGVGVGHGVGMTSGNLKTSSSTIGISLVSNKGKVGVGISGGGNSIYSTQSASSSVSTFGISAGFYLYGFTIKLGYQESSYSRNKLDYDYIYGPLYFKNLSDNPHNASNSNISYPSSIANSHNRDIFMDTYEQAVPQYIGSEVAFKDAFDMQKNSYNTAAYDNYDVNAQGLSGRMSPRLMENGLLINRGYDLQYAEENRGTTCAYNVCGNPYDPTSCTPIGPNGPPHPSQIGTHITDKRLFINSHFSNDSNHKFKNSFGGSVNNTINFYFDYQFPSDLRINPLNFNAFNNATSLENYFNSVNTTISSRKENSDYIETFTNGQITSGNVNGYFLEAKDYNRSQDKGYRPDGIGGYRITTTDGKTYHYSRPVYQFEQVYRHLEPKYENGYSAPNSYPESDGYYKEVRKKEPYATHWVLTAVTGPDFVKMTNNPYPEEGDMGYWVRFDYGKWTDGYVWRTPFEGYNKRNSNIAIASDDYSWGRKQLVYLDKIVTRTHTALFVKSLREDEVGKNIGSGGYPTSDGDENVNYIKQQSLKLDEIILLKNDEDTNQINSNNQIRNLINGPSNHWVDWNSMDDLSYPVNQQQGVLDKGDLELNSGQYSVYSKALKIIKLNQSYNLAKNSPNSIASTKGRLTLEGIDVLGRNGESFMPPYLFDYVGENTNYTNSNDRDDWGYNKNNASLWTLNRITTPLGSKIDFEYENDEYYTEAFSRRMFDEDDFKFRVFTVNGQPRVEFQKSSYLTESINFLNYFTNNEATYTSLYCCYSEDDNWPTSSGNRHWVTCPGQALNIVSVSANNIIFDIPFPPQAAWDGNFHDITGSDFREKGSWNCFVGSECQNDNSHSAWVFNFKVLANKVPNGIGGGIRVSKIKTSDEVGNFRISEYDYKDPSLNRTSGITSYAPSKGSKFIAYQTEIPGPRVMYEYVKITEKNFNNESLGSTLYNFNVLKQVLNVFDPNMRAGNHFKATVGVTGLDAYKNSTGVQVKLEDNFGTIGGVKSITELNKHGQIMNKVINSFLTLEDLADNSVEKPGVLQESFHSMKSVFDYHKDWMSGNANIGVSNWDVKCDGEESISTKKRLVNSSSKIIYPLVQNKKTIINGTGKQIIEYKNIDPKSGLYLETYTTKADGKLIKTEKIPAYTKYPAMGSKVSNVNNKHMLTQETMDLTSVNVSGVWKTIDASITTWNDTWAYRNESTGQDQTDNTHKIWRKHKAFAWKDQLKEDGVFLTNISKTNPYFDWGLGTPLSNKWQKLSEITRYTHWSMPIETKDINGNFASSKMADKDSKVLVSGNARYTEMYYSGAEHVKSGNLFDGEVKGANFRSSVVAHTGKYSVKPNAAGDHIFEINGSSGSANYYSQATPYNETFRPGKYKVSFWALSQGSPTKSAELMLNNVLQQPSEVIDAGCWKQFIYIVNIPVNNANNSVVLTTNQVYGYEYYDDFRMHPIASSINSYVYNQETDELAFVLDAQNMGTAYKYDSVGRLLATYNEIIDADNGTQTIDGGFKIAGQYKQTYKGMNPNVDQLSGSLNNCILAPLFATISNECIASFENKFKVNVMGGSGYYSYQYKWKTNIDNNLFTNYIAGSSTANIPYVPKYCDENNYLKVWSFVAKVTDTQTGQFIEIPYEYESGICNNPIIPERDIADVEISKCFQTCDNAFSFRIHLKDIGYGNNYQYEYAYYDPNTPFYEQSLEWIDVTSTNGRFCPDTFEHIENSSCPNGYYMKTLYFTYRVKNLSTGNYSYHLPSVVMLECVNSCGTCKTVELTSEELNYSKEGVVIVKDEDGKILSVYNINNLK